MFGFGKHRRLAKMIETFQETWSMALALDAALLRKGELPPSPGAEYFAILWGAVDSLAQSIGADMSTTMKALDLYLGRYADAAEVGAKIRAAARHRDLQHLILESGAAVHAMHVGKLHPTQALLPLVDKYRSVIAGN